MHGLGIIEGFFGPEWSWEERHSICDFLKAEGARYYFYAPKRDAYLRKQWTEEHPLPFATELLSLREHARKNGLRFGIGLSPFELHSQWEDPKMREALATKVRALQKFSPDFLGLFFDDMRGCPDLAEKQIAIVKFVGNLVRDFKETKTTLLFCPTYYSDDPILDKVFGERPPGYLEEIGAGIPAGVEILWTGKKVISPEISASELAEVASVLRRKPFLWDNLFANDGPRMCKFLKLKPANGRNAGAYAESSGWAFNLMNQASLSKIAFLGAKGALENHGTPEVCFKEAVFKLCPPALARNVLLHTADFNEKGLDQLTEAQKAELVNVFKASAESVSGNIVGWLEGKYLVGPECLTD